MANIVRRVRTVEGAAYFGLPIGAIITRDAVKKARAKNGGKSAPKGATSTQVSSGAFSGNKPKATQKSVEQSDKSTSDAKKTLGKEASLPAGTQELKMQKHTHLIPDDAKIIRSKNNPGRVAYVQTSEGKTYAVVDDFVSDDIPADVQGVIQSAMSGDEMWSVSQPLTADTDTYNPDADPLNSPVLNVAELPAGEVLTDKFGKSSWTKTGESEWTDTNTDTKYPEHAIQHLVDFGTLGQGSTELPELTEPTNLAELLGDDADPDTAKGYLGGLEPGQKAEFLDGRVYTFDPNDEGPEDDRWHLEGGDESDDLTSDEVAAFAPIVSIHPASEDDNAPEAPAEEDTSPSEDDNAPDAPEAEDITPDADEDDEDLDAEEETPELTKEQEDALTDSGFKKSELSEAAKNLKTPETITKESLDELNEGDLVIAKDGNGNGQTVVEKTEDGEWFDYANEQTFSAEEIEEYATPAGTTSQPAEEPEAPTDPQTTEEPEPNKTPAPKPAPKKSSTGAKTGISANSKTPFAKGESKEITTATGVQALRDDYEPEWLKGTDTVYHKGEVTQDSIVDAPTGTVLDVDGKPHVKLSNGMWFDGDLAVSDTDIIESLNDGEAKVSNPNELEGYNGIANVSVDDKKKAKKDAKAATKEKASYAAQKIEEAKAESGDEFGASSGYAYVESMVDDADKLVLTVNDKQLTKAEVIQAYQALSDSTAFQVVYGLQNLPASHPLADYDTAHAFRTVAMNRYKTSKAKAAALLTLKEAAELPDSPILQPKGKSLLVGDFKNKKSNVQGPAFGFFSIDDIHDAVAIMEATDKKVFKSVLTANINPLGDIDPTKVTGGDADKFKAKQKYLDALKKVLDTSALVPTMEQYKARLASMEHGQKVFDRHGNHWSAYIDPEVPTAVGFETHDKKSLVGLDNLYNSRAKSLTFVSQTKLTDVSDLPEEARVFAMLDGDESPATMFRRTSNGWVKVYDEGASLNTDSAILSNEDLLKNDVYRVLPFTTDTEDIFKYDPNTGDAIFDEPTSADEQMEEFLDGVAEQFDLNKVYDIPIALVEGDGTPVEDADDVAVLNPGASIVNSSTHDYWVKGVDGKWTQETPYLTEESLSEMEDFDMAVVVTPHQTPNVFFHKSPTGAIVVNSKEDGAYVTSTPDSKAFVESLAHKPVGFLSNPVSEEDLAEAPAGTIAYFDSASGVPHRFDKTPEGTWVRGSSEFAVHYSSADLAVLEARFVLHSPKKSEENQTMVSKTTEEVLDDAKSNDQEIVVDVDPLGPKDGTKSHSVAQLSNEEYMSDEESNSLQPGKYTTKNGKAYMIVHEDGTGTYHNTSGGTKKLTKHAVHKNHEAGMTTYHGAATDDDKNPAPFDEADKKKISKNTKQPKNAKDWKLEDGTYYSGDQTKASAFIFEVKDGVISKYSPKVSEDIGHYKPYKVGDNAGNAHQMEKYGDGTVFSISAAYNYGNPTPNSKLDGVTRIRRTGDNMEFLSNTGEVLETKSTKKKEGTSDSEFTEYMDLHGSDYSFAHGFYAYIDSFGTVGKGTATKNFLYKKAVEGSLTDSYGTSVVAGDFTGTAYVLGKQHNMAELKKNLTSFENNEFGGSGLIQTVGGKASLLKKYMDDTEGEGVFDLSTDEGIENTAKALKSYLDDYLDGLDMPELEGDASEAFEYDTFGNPKMVLPDSTHFASIQYWNLTTGDLSQIIKSISAKFGGGGIIGMHYTKMSKDDKTDWINRYKAGDFKSMYNLESAAAAKANTVHASGFKHPGYTNNTDTHTVKWAPAVEGEKAAGTKIEGDWSSSTHIASMEEIDNYILLATMQNPTYLDNAEKRLWVTHHRANNQMQVDAISLKAKIRKDSGEKQLSEPPVFTENVQPAKSYTSLFDTTKFPTSWGYAQADDYMEDHPELSEKKAEFDQTMGYPTHVTTFVSSYFQGLADEEYQKSLIPVYSISPKQALGKGTHPAYNVKDQFDNEFVFKPRYDDSKLEQHKGELEHAGNMMGSLFGFKTPKSEMVEIEVKGQKKYGQLQKMVPNVVGTMNTTKLDSLSAKQLAAIGSEHMLDWILDNDDTHGENLLVTSSGDLIGIDKGRSFKKGGHSVPGNWKGLDIHQMNSNANTVYSQLYKAVMSGKLDKAEVDKAYLAIRAKAIRMQKVSDAKVDAVLKEGMKNREDFQNNFTIDGKKVPNTYEGFLQAVNHRKENLAADFEKLWGGVYKDAGWGDLPEPSTEAPEGISAGLMDADHMTKTFESKSVGHSTFLGGANVIGGFATSHIEKNLAGESIFSTEMFLAPQAQKNVLSAIQAEVGEAPKEGTMPFPAESYYDRIMSAAKTINHHSADGEYNMDKINGLKAAMSDIEKDMNSVIPEKLKSVYAGSPAHTFPSGHVVPEGQLPQYKKMLEYYDSEAKKAWKSYEEKVKVTPHVSKFEASSLKTSGVHTNLTTGEKLTPTTDGKYMYTKPNGDLEFVTFDSEVAVLAASGVGGWAPEGEPEKGGTALSKYKVKLNDQTYEREGKLQDGYKTQISTSPAKSKGSYDYGKEYEIVLPTGESIFYRNATSTGTPMAKQGKVSFRFEADGESSAEMHMQNIQDALDELGIDYTPATEESIQNSYWREMYGVLQNRITHAQDDPRWGKARKDFEKRVAEFGGLPNEFIENMAENMTPEEQNDWWQEFFSQWWPEEISDLIENRRYLPSLAKNSVDSPELRNGKPVYYRFDWKSEYAQILKSKRVTGHGFTGSKTKTLIDSMLGSGGLLGAEERLRVADSAHVGMSPHLDQKYGSSHFVYTRQFSSTSTNWDIVLHPKSMLTTRTYSINADEYGKFSVRNDQSPTTPSAVMKSHNSSSNETMIPWSTTILDDFGVVVLDPTLRNYFIQELKKRGILEINGRPIEDIFVTETGRAAALAKFKAYIANWEVGNEWD